MHLPDKGDLGGVPKVTTVHILHHSYPLVWGFFFFINLALCRHSFFRILLIKIWENLQKEGKVTNHSLCFCSWSESQKLILINSLPWLAILLAFLVGWPHSHPNGSETWLSGPSQIIVSTLIDLQFKLVIGVQKGIFFPVSIL